MSARKPTSNRARRILTLLHLFSDGNELPLATVAAALEVDVSQARRELELLSCCGVLGSEERLVPVYIDDESDEEIVVFWGEAPGLSRRLRFSAAESRALVAALTAAGLDSADPLMVKLEAALGSATTFESIEQMLRGCVAVADSDLLKVLALALEQNAVIAMTYHTGGGEQGTAREVEPVALVQERGDWYLEAYCRKARALRTFRVDRISEANPTGEHFERREPSGSATTFLSDRLPLATVKLAPGEDYSARSWPGSRVVETRPDGTRLVEVPYAGTSWLARQVVARLGGAEVLAPEEVRVAVAELAEQALRAC